MPCDPLEPIRYVLFAVIFAIVVAWLSFAALQYAWSILQVLAVTIGACR